jgi:hypothetical protein
MPASLSRLPQFMLPNCRYSPQSRPRAGDGWIHEISITLLEMSVVVR